MAVVNGAWWGAWWGWMALWLVAAAGVLAMAALLAVLVRRRLRGPVREHSGPSMCVYLDEQAVKNLDEVGNHNATLERVVEERRNVTTTAGFLTKLMPFELKADRGATQETFTSYVQSATPLSVVGVLLSVFDREDAIVHVDLSSGAITPNRVLARKLAAARDDEARAAEVVLSDVTQFVSVEGRFGAEPGADDGFVLRARYGGAGQSAHVKVACAASWLQIDKMYEGEFQARCLGKIIGWNQNTREVTLDAIAIFR